MLEANNKSTPEINKYQIDSEIVEADLQPHDEQNNQKIDKNDVSDASFVELDQVLSTQPHRIRAKRNKKAANKQAQKINKRVMTNLDQTADQISCIKQSSSVNQAVTKNKESLETSSNSLSDLTKKLLQSPRNAFNNLHSSTKPQQQFLGRRKRTRKSRDQVQALERCFRKYEGNQPSKQIIQTLAADLNLNENQIYKWFWDAQQKIQFDGGHILLTRADSNKAISTTQSGSPTRECVVSSATANHQNMYPKIVDEFGGYSKRQFVPRTIIVNTALASTSKQPVENSIESRSSSIVSASSGSLSKEDQNRKSHTSPERHDKEGSKNYRQPNHKQNNLQNSGNAIADELESISLQLGMDIESLAQEIIRQHSPRQSRQISKLTKQESTAGQPEQSVSVADISSQISLDNKIKLPFKSPDRISASSFSIKDSAGSSPGFANYKQPQTPQSFLKAQPVQTSVTRSLLLDSKPYQSTPLSSASTGKKTDLQQIKFAIGQTKNRLLSPMMNEDQKTSINAFNLLSNNITTTGLALAPTMSTTADSLTLKSITPTGSSLVSKPFFQSLQSVFMQNLQAQVSTVNANATTNNFDSNAKSAPAITTPQRFNFECFRNTGTQQTPLSEILGRRNEKNVSLQDNIFIKNTNNVEQPAASRRSALVGDNFEKMLSAGFKKRS